ncbi:unnamed protein product [Cylindrotheca closterium]|uniref:Reverse transcriptase domain-containing protein n=1 Tax=Cylindrotheca closterium TaxID=2856 RepID=A0AAD2JPA8_9STRA|nr:unnamed protein product [Cylindrotheca closterium]
MGIIGSGCEVMRYAWPKMTVSFSIRENGETVPSDLEDPPVVLFGPHRSWKGLLNTYPVDLLVIERGNYKQPSGSPRREPWEDMVESVPPEKRPKLVIECWRSDPTLWQYGPTSKATTTRWRDIGYYVNCRTINATSIGGAINQERLLVARTRADIGAQWVWDNLDRDLAVIRPMGNLLTPPGLVPRSSYSNNGTNHTPYSLHDPMPNQIGAYIRTEKGVRRLLKEEMARGLGIPKGPEMNLSKKSLQRTTSLFHWEYLSHSLQHLFPMPALESRPTPAEDGSSNESSSPAGPTTCKEFGWVPADLSPGGTWHQQRISNLRWASEHYPEPKDIFDDGLHRLAVHRQNYDQDGPSPKWLQLLWWEFPSEHWEELRTGARQNFLERPEPHIRPNAPMDEEMLEAAVQFVDELVELGVLRHIDEGLKVLTNAPLFVVGKDGQPGEWRVIADMLRGGQNDCVGQDPVFMPRIAHIVDQMYTGGFSAVVDLSKFFYNFPTHPEDRPYLGLLHPKTEELLTYYGLAMGAGNSPAIACRIGLAFVRLVKEKFDVFQGEAKANCYWTGFQNNGFDPKLGYGFILTSADGGAVHIWVWVDDFLIHGPSHEKTTRALAFFLDTAVDCGFLFHPKKLVPPQQVVKYCGFLFDTTDIPCLRIPESKKDRALAICEYLLQSPTHKKWSRLSLAVAVGVLESLTEATPRRLGHTHLKEFHTLVHPPGLGIGAEPYYTTTCLNSRVLDELKWWKQFLLRSEGRFVRGWEAATLVPTFGDGSGTGTGGTLQLPNCDFEMWRGKWKPAVYIFASVWKELATLKETLLRIKESPQAHLVIGTTVFYFTDNSGVYWIATTGSSKRRDLHQLLSEIRLLELDLQCVLQVVHVPGRVLITQGTDGLSRGVWMSTLQDIMDSDRLTQAIFDPMPLDWTLVWQHLPHLAHMAQYRSWNQQWTADLCLHQTTVWCPPPELARQLLTFLLNSWVECPFTTSALLFVPRVVEASWRHMSRYIEEIGTIYPHQTQLRFPPLLPIPIVVLHIAPHTLSLTPSRLDKTPTTAPSWHAAQATLMRRLPDGIHQESH